MNLISSKLYINLSWRGKEQLWVKLCVNSDKVASFSHISPSILSESIWEKNRNTLMKGYVTTFLGHDGNFFRNRLFSECPKDYFMPEGKVNICVCYFQLIFSEWRKKSRVEKYILAHPYCQASFVSVSPGTRSSKC